MMEEVCNFSEEYKEFVRECKTEFEVVENFKSIAKKNDFDNLEKLESLKEGDRVYWTHKDSMCFFAKIGEKKDKIRLIVAHADSPRIEVKINPLDVRKEENLTTLKISYYGGIIPYHWVNIPLEIRGILYKDGKKYNFRYEGVVISDNLPHLSKLRYEERKGKDVVRWEEVRIAVGMESFNFLEFLSSKLGIEVSEKDFGRMRLFVVPSIEPVDLGLDKSMIGAYGHDDKSCCFASFKALIDSPDVPPETSVLIIVDNEEIGSTTNTSARSYAIDYFIEEILRKSGFRGNVREVMLNSKAISADVSAAVTPCFEDVYDLKNSPIIGKGVSIERYLNNAGKYYDSETSLDFMDWLIRIFDKSDVKYQFCSVVSKTDPRIGGGGTVRAYFSMRGMDAVDVGVPVIGMHTPFEVISKFDLYQAYIAYRAFYSG